MTVYRTSPIVLRKPGLELVALGSTAEEKERAKIVSES
jgi:hypothetical protein